MFHQWLSFGPMWLGPLCTRNSPGHGRGCLELA
jgi:hypothetical protein